MEGRRRENVLKGSTATLLDSDSGVSATLTVQGNQS